MRHGALALILATSGLALAQPAPTYSTERVFPGLRFRAATHLTHAGDGSGRLFVSERRGVVYAIAGTPTPLTTTPAKTVFLDISARVRSTQGNEEGLLSVAFHPRFAQNGFVFVAYTTGSQYLASPTSTPTTSTVRTRISRFTVLPGTVATAAPETVLIEIPKRFFNHNGGQLAFGSDGMLYISTGDGGSAGDPDRTAQNKRNLKGKILRINVDVAGTTTPYSIPANNPFFNQPTARGEVYAYGLRNPWRFSFDRATGELWCGDVGQDSREEVDVITRGGNYGWSRFEGRQVFNQSVTAASPINPVWDYAIGNNGRSVIGGFVYRGTRVASLQGAYLCADFFSGKVWSVRRSTTPGGAATVRTLLTDPNLAVSSFGEDGAGEVYLVSYKEDGTGGIYRLKEGAGGSGGGVIGQLQPTFQNVQSIFTSRCVSCHSGGHGPRLSAGSAFAAIVNKPAGQLPSMSYIKPGAPQQSYLFRKISGTHVAAGGSGSRMPLSGAALSSADVSLIERWIAEGAQNN